jgi:hypothetical protein
MTCDTSHRRGGMFVLLNFCGCDECGIDGRKCDLGQKNHVVLHYAISERPGWGVTHVATSSFLFKKAQLASRDTRGRLGLLGVCWT